MKKMKSPRSGMLLCKVVAACAVLLLGNAKADGFSESPLGANPQDVEWVITKDNGTTFVKFLNVSRYYSFNNKPGILASLLSAKAAGQKVRIYSTTAANGEATHGLPDLGNSNQSHYLGAVWVLD